VPPAYFTGDSHGQSKEARCCAQEEPETRQGKRQAGAQEGGKARGAKQGEVQGPAGGQERGETGGQEKAAIEDGGKKNTKTSG
jgi:hypothetical protein